MQSHFIVYECGVVVTGESEKARVLSTRKTDLVPKVNFNTASRDIWAYWYPDASREIRLIIPFKGNQVLEGEQNSLPEFYRIATKLAKRERSASRSVGIALYNFSAAHVHLRMLLKEYIRLTTVIGPNIQFDESPVVAIPYPECHVTFDAFMVSLRSYADSLRFIIWDVLGYGAGMPRSLRSLIKTTLPENLKNTINNYIEKTMEEISGYRDNSVHYAPPGAHTGPYIIFSNNILNAQVWLPENPEVRSLKKFKYYQKDAFRFARELLGKTYEFNSNLFPILDALQREKLKINRRRRE